jgi:hypothetical protein
MARRYGIAKSLGFLVFALVCVVALVTQVGANVLLLGGMAGESVTDPGTLTLLGAAMVGAGVSTRRLFFARKRRL